MTKKILTILVMSVMLSVLAISLVSAVEANVCCEKTAAGAWCQNTVEGNCDESFRSTPTNCEATSFCKKGCCFDSAEGLCMENTPEKVCSDTEGTWVDDSECNVPQCNLGCCVLGNQASFVTLTRCKKLSGFFGLETNFRKDVGSELSCIELAASQDTGACVFESEFQTTCKFTTRGECQGTQLSEEGSSDPEFYKDFLCSAEELATNCGLTKDTICVAGKQEVYFVDTCGNPANIYDASKVEDKSYWRKLVSKAESCGFNAPKGNAGSKSCGNCDYFSGSICAKGDATYGNNFCNDLNCYNTENGNNYKNGESWCIYDDVTGEGKDKVGSRHYRHVCINGVETVEPCADFRNEQCIQANAEVEGDVFSEAACRVNRWTDCIDQDEEDDCLNEDRRDCFWSSGAEFTGLEELQGSTPVGGSSGGVFGGGSTGGFGGGLTGRAIFGGGDDDEGEEEAVENEGVQLGGEACLPDIPPGLKFWSDGGDASGICSLGNSVCVVSYGEGILGKEKCVENCECLGEDYAKEMNRVCTSLGDCGAYVNIANKFTDDGAEWKVGGKKKTIGPSIVQGLRR